MIRTPSALLLILRYCVFDVTFHAILGEQLSASVGDVSPSGDCLLQKAHTHQEAVLGKAAMLLFELDAVQPVPAISLVAQASQRSSIANSSSAAQAVDHAEIPHTPDGTHHSIFELSFAQLDRTTFWFIFGCMLIFTIIVDRTENWVTERVSHNPSSQQFLIRINSELMMFGTVGMFLFVIKNLKDLPKDQDTIIEFVDILCSMGACGLIAIAIVLLIMRMYSSGHWKHLESVNIDDEVVSPTGSVDISLARKIFNHSRLQPMDYQVMAKRFVHKYSLPTDFVYSDYLNHTFARNACKLMDIKWYCWLVMLLIVLVFFAIRFCRGVHFPNIVYITLFACSNWSMLISMCVLFVIVNAAHCDLLSEIRKDQEELQKEGIKMGDRFDSKPKATAVDPKARAWSMRVHFALQLTSLFNSFLLSFYVMHLQFNLAAAGLHWLWSLKLLFPLLVSLLVMLPAIISQLSVVEAYLSPDGDALEDTLSMLNQLEEDLDCVRRTWKAAGEPEFPALEVGVDEEGFAELLRDVGVHISEGRTHRIFIALDDDKSGTITTDELMTRLKDEDTSMLDVTSSNSVDALGFISPHSRPLQKKKTFTFRNA